jgi:serine O-acetyltransferase
VVIEVISATEPDWSREAKRFFEWAPSRSLLASIRSYQRHAGCGGPWHRLVRGFATLRHRFWSVVTATDIPVNARIGGGLMIPHPNGIVIHPEVTVGPNCFILQQVTLGLGRGGLPTIGGDVNIGAGAKVLGGISVGDHAVIGAMAVVTHDVPERALMMGIPARVVRQAAPGEPMWKE